MPQPSSTSRSILVRGIDAVLAGSGFTRFGLMWRAHGPETVVALELQKSNYSLHYYVNLGYYLKGSEQPGTFDEKNIAFYSKYYRLGDIARWPELDLKLFDFAISPFDPTERKEAIEAMTRTVILPILNGFRTRDGLRDFYRSHPDLRMAGWLERALSQQGSS